MLRDTFVFKSYLFNVESKSLALNYGFNDGLHFTETYHFDFAFVNFNTDQLDKALQHLFFMAGVSYYKAYPSREIVIEAGQLSQQDAAFFADTYQKGLGEFFYVNQLDPQTVIPFTGNSDTTVLHDSAVQDGLLIGLGGGKDSLVSIELLRSQPRVATWSLGHYRQLEPLIAAIGLPHFQVSRNIDALLLGHNAKGALNGHVPISAILACVSTIVGILAGYSTSVVSNENSANEPTLTYQGTEINHQYSKSLEFEKAYQNLLLRTFSEVLQYFSLLRPLSELQIAKIFTVTGFDNYKSVFSSCNRAFTQASELMSWCGKCPKCAFVYLALAPFIDNNSLNALWSGKNLLLDPELESTYKQLLGINADKPLECVGEILESRAAMRAAQQVYPELRKFEFDVPADYDYLLLAAHAMPKKYFDLMVAGAGRANNVIE